MFKLELPAQNKCGIIIIEKLNSLGMEADTKFHGSFYIIDKYVMVWDQKPTNLQEIKDKSNKIIFDY